MMGHSTSHAIEASTPEGITEQIKAFGWDNDYDQIHAGAFRGRVELAQIGAVQVASLSYSAQILSRGMPPAGSIVLGLVGHVRGRARWRGHPVTSDLVIVADETTGIDLLMGEEFGLWLMIMPEALLDRGTGHGLDSLRMPPTSQRRLIEHIRFGLEVASTTTKGGMSPGAVAAYEAKTLALANGSFLAEGSWSTPPALGLELEALLRTHDSEPRSVPQLAARLSTSERTLRRASRKAFGCSPLQLDRTLRLNAAHRALRLASPTTDRIWKIAARHGFWHMGQFGRDFHRLFGERPNEVLASKP